MRPIGSRSAQRIRGRSSACWMMRRIPRRVLRSCITRRLWKSTKSEKCKEGTMKIARVEIISKYPDNKMFSYCYVRIMFKNGKILAHTEMYNTYNHAEKVALTLATQIECEVWT